MPDSRVPGRMFRGPVAAPSLGCEGGRTWPRKEGSRTLGSRATPVNVARWDCTAQASSAMCRVTHPVAGEARAASPPVASGSSRSDSRPLAPPCARASLPHPHPPAVSAFVWWAGRTGPAPRAANPAPRAHPGRSGRCPSRAVSPRRAAAPGSRTTWRCLRGTQNAPSSQAFLSFRVAFRTLMIRPVPCPLRCGSA